MKYLKKLALLLLVPMMISVTSCGDWILTVDLWGDFWLSIENEMDSEYSSYSNIPEGSTRYVKAVDGNTTVFYWITNGTDNSTNIPTVANATITFEAQMELNPALYDSKIFVNGAETTSIMNSEGIVSASCPLKNGNNYLMALIYDKGSTNAKYRSKIVKVKANLRVPKYQFVLSWDSAVDLDLYVRDGSGSAWNIGGKSSNSVSNATLDIINDLKNDQGYGPENTKIYTMPTGNLLHCYVNYTNGTVTNVNASVYFYKDVSGTLKLQWSKNFNLNITNKTGTVGYVDNYSYWVTNFAVQ